MFQAPALWSAGWGHKAAFPQPVCLWLYMCEHICAWGWWGGGGCYNNKWGSSVTLNSPIFQKGSKQNCLFLHICTEVPELAEYFMAVFRGGG